MMEEKMDGLEEPEYNSRVLLGKKRRPLVEDKR
jgi:hypothetical protein